MKHIFNYIFFSTLNNVIGKKTNCLNVNKFSLLQTVKFYLLSAGTETRFLKISYRLQIKQKNDMLEKGLQ